MIDLIAKGNFDGRPKAGLKLYVQRSEANALLAMHLAKRLRITLYFPQYLTVLSSLLCPSSNCTARRFFR
jgi:hypothetical protein